jgi:glycosyltransferase 2 family protein
VTRTSADRSSAPDAATAAAGRSPRLGTWLRVAGTVALGAFVVAKAGPSGVLSAAAGAQPGLLGLAVLLYVVDRFAAAARWRMLYVARGHRLGLLEATRIYLQSSFLGAALPSGVGGDIIRARMVARDGEAFRHAISSVVLERLLGTVALVVMACVCLALFGPRASWAAAIPYLVAGAVVAALGVAMVLGPPVPDRWPGNLRGFPRAVVSFLIDVHERVRGYGRLPGVLAMSSAIAFGQQILLTGINWILALALGLAIPLAAMLWMWPLVMLAVRLPISILGFGVREALLLGLFAATGRPAAEAVLLGLASGFLDLLFIAVGGVLLAVAPVRSEAR